MDRRVMLLPSIPTVDGKDARILTLPYPASGEPAGFVLVPVPEMDMTSTETITTTSTTETTTIESKLHIHSRLLMIQQIEGPFKSWAIDNYIIADGSLYVATPYDPLFLLAPILDTHRQKTDESAGRFMQWSDLTSSEDFPDLALLPTTINEAILSNICDINDVDSIGRFYRLNDLKFLDWLKAKVEHLANKAACHSIDAFIPLVQDAKLVHNISDDSSLHRRIAFQAICEHINVKWMNLLMTHLSISDESIWSKQHVYFNPEITKRSASASSATPNLKPTKQAKLTRGQQSIAKASKGGMKHITSFFKPVAAKSASK